jgi:dTMP kinase
MPGLLITFEGVEGAGKSTQIALLRDSLMAKGYEVLATREPGGGPIGEAIRSILLSKENPVTNRAEMLLFLAARAQLTEQTIKPHLDAGGIVLCDRYIDSTTAYQGYARGNDLELVSKLNEYATGGLKPGLTILLDLEPSHGLLRQQEHNRMEAQSLQFHERVRDGFLKIAAEEPDRFRVLDATETPERLHTQILDEVTKALEHRKA